MFASCQLFVEVTTRKKLERNPPATKDLRSKVIDGPVGITLRFRGMSADRLMRSSLSEWAMASTDRLRQCFQRDRCLCRHLAYGKVQGIYPVVARHLGPVAVKDLIEASRLYNSNGIVGRILG